MVRHDHEHILRNPRVHGPRGTIMTLCCREPGLLLTGEYQILLDKKYGRAVDWWAFGVLIYQMLLQQSPFRGEDEDEIYDAILADEPLYPIHMPRDSVSILQKLLTREPDQRLGSGPTDAQEVMSQPFFRTINWDDIYHKRVQPPFKPTIKNATDTSNFDSEFTSVTPVLTPVQSGKLDRNIVVIDLLLTPCQFCRKPCKKNSGVFRTLQTLNRLARDQIDADDDGLLRLGEHTTGETKVDDGRKKSGELEATYAGGCGEV